MIDYYKRIKEIKKLLHNYNYEYYINHKSIISDFEFDSILNELIQLEKLHPEIVDLNSPTQRVGGGITKKFNTIYHSQKMYSLDNTYSHSDVLEWEQRIKKKLNSDKIEFSCELKYDGASINLTYIDGDLIKGVTRGDGFRGDDVTQNIKTIKSIPLKLKGEFPSKFDIRGEIIMTLDGFKQLNKERVSQGEPIYMNPRNTASGSIKLQDSKEVSKRPLMGLMYGFSSDIEIFKNHFDALTEARKWGFKIPEHCIKVNSVKGVFDFLNLWQTKRNELNYEIDGVVIKVNNLEQQKSLGFTSKSPRWAIAYKFKAERLTTVINSVAYQVGRTGAITPVANLAPILLSGSIVKRASLHNADQIDKLNLRIGDNVFVEKGGEIIPKIVGVDLTNRGDVLNQIKFITNCPECNSKLVRLDGEAQHYCTNYINCDPQMIARIQHFIGRNAMNIDGLGMETVSFLYKSGLVVNIADLYDLKYNDIIGLERMAEKSANNLLQGVLDSKKQPFNKVLFGIGIRHVGATVAKRLASIFKSMDSISRANFDELVSVEDIGDRIAESVKDFFSNEYNIYLIKRLRDHGVKMFDNQTKISKILDGKSIVISGVFDTISRDELKKRIEQNGGVNTSSISSKTSFVIFGKGVGPSKKKKAALLKINIIDEKYFLKMLEI